MFGQKYTLTSAVLMTMAALAWGFVLVMGVVLGDGGVPSILNALVFTVFAVLAVLYWVWYFRKKNDQANTQPSGTE